MNRYRHSLLLLVLPNIVWPGCHISSNGLRFGNYDVFAVWPQDAVVTLTISCYIPHSLTQGTLLSAGPSATSGRITERALSGTADRLVYNLFVDPARTRIWGNSGSGGESIVLSQPSTTQRIPIYARIPAEQNIAAGNYTDTTTVTIVP